MRYRGAIDRLRDDVAALKRNAPTSRLRLYDLGDEIGQSTWAGGAVECIVLPRESESVGAWLASCNDWIPNH